MKRKYMSESAFEAMRERDEVEDFVVYVVSCKSGRKFYAVSPDAVGFCFYDSNAEVKEAYGE